jgi:hypothetical protein
LALVLAFLGSFCRKHGLGVDVVLVLPSRIWLDDEGFEVWWWLTRTATRHLIVCPWFFCIFVWIWWWWWCGFGAAHWSSFVLFAAKVVMLRGITFLPVEQLVQTMMELYMLGVNTSLRSAATLALYVAAFVMFWFDTICVTASWLWDCRLLLLYVIVLVIEWL